MTHLTVSPVLVDAALFNQCNSQLIRNYRLDAAIKNILNVVGKHYRGCMQNYNYPFPELTYHHVNTLMGHDAFRFYRPDIKSMLFSCAWDDSWYNPHNPATWIFASHQLLHALGVFMGMGVFTKGRGMRSWVGVSRAEGMGYITALHEFNYYSHELYHVAYNQAGE